MKSKDIKQGIRDVLNEKEIESGRIRFTKLRIVENNITEIYTIFITLDSIDNVCIDVLKSAVDEFLDSIGVQYLGLYLDI